MAAETTPDAVGSPDAVELSTRARDSAELAADQGVTLDRQVLEELDTQVTTDFWVALENEADLSGAEEITDWAERGEFVHDRLTQAAQEGQAALTTRLQHAGVEFESFWIANALLIRDADHAMLDGMLSQDEVAQVHADEAIDLPDPIAGQDEASVAAVEWGIANIRADQVWSELGVRGEDIVVGSIDSGVDFTHPALVNQYRGNLGEGQFDHDYNWWDPSSVCPTAEPCDNHGHGTHTTGTMVGDDGGDNQIGVAPGARWMAAKGCRSNTCTLGALLSSGEFMLAPTTVGGAAPRPELRPHIINNSWGSPNGPSIDSFYRDIVTAWTAAGIFGVFSNGNEGPGCDTAGSPADYVESWGVGAYDSENSIASFSSRGPGEDGVVRPSISAPGVQVRSSFPDNLYASGSGTSMAAPHVSGTVALMWSASDLVGDIDATREALAATAVDTEDLTCGGTPENNNVYGEGRLDALEAAVEVAVNSGVTGTVIDADSGQPLAGVTLTVHGEGRDRETDENGQYTLRLQPGTYTLEFSLFGYLTHTVPDVVVTEDTFTSVDVDLESAPNGSLSGTVTDEVSGHTIPGVTVEVLDVPVDLNAATDADGGYEVPSLPVGTYTIRADTPRPGLWQPVTEEVTVIEADTVPVDFSMPLAGAAVPVSISSDGAHGSESVFDNDASISADGRYVSFFAAPNDLVDTPVSEFTTYVHDRHTGMTELVPGGTGDTMISGDGRYVAFEGLRDLVDERAAEHPPHPKYTYQFDDRVYVYDRATGQIEHASVNSKGEALSITGSVSPPAITPDGRFVSFVSNAPHIAPEELPACVPPGGVPGLPQEPGSGWAFTEILRAPCPQVAIHDRATGQTEVVSVSSDGEMENGWAGKRVTLTPDGRTVAFRSDATNLVGEETNPGFDIFVHDRDTGETEWVSRQPTPGGFLQEIDDPVMSDDGRVVAYQRQFAGLGAVYDRTTGETEPLSVPLDDEPLALSRPLAISSDGRLVTFYHVALEDDAATLIPEGTGLFVLDRDTDQVERLPGFPYHQELATSGIDTVTQISSDGRSMVLVGDGQLAPGDTNGVKDLYVVDLEHEPDTPQARFAVWDLSLGSRDVLPGQPVDVTVMVRNVGDAAGDYEAGMLVDSLREESASQTVTLQPGETTELTLRVAHEAGGRHVVRVGQAVGEFRVHSATLSGVVNDSNDGLALEGATVTATNGQTTRTATTFAGGAYQLDELALGTWTVTVEAEDHTTETLEVNLTDDGQQVTRDAVLRAGQLGVGTEAVEITLPAGSIGTAEATVSNPGTADLDFNAFAWEASGDDEPSILVYTPVVPDEDTHIDQALSRLGLDATIFRETCDPFHPPEAIDQFRAALADGEWDLVIFDHGCAFTGAPFQAAFDVLTTYANDGGTLVFYGRQGQPREDGPKAPDLVEALGVEFVQSWSLPAGNYWWDTDHDMFTSPLSVPEFLTDANDMLRLQGDSEALAGYTLTARPDHAGMVLGNDGRTLYQGARPGIQRDADPRIDPYAWSDLDGNGVADSVQLWVNTIVYMGGLTVQPWLAVNDSGTLVPDDSTEIAVSVDATSLEPGTYTGTVELVTNAAREPNVTVPLTLEVTEAAPVTFDSLRELVEVFEGDGDVTRAGAARLLSAVGQAERHYDRGADDRAITVLERFQETASDPKFVPSEAARDALVADAEQLIAWLGEHVSAGATAPLGGQHVPT